MRTKKEEEKRHTFLDEKVWGKNLKKIYIFEYARPKKNRENMREKNEIGLKPFNKFLQIERKKVVWNKRMLVL